MDEETRQLLREIRDSIREDSRCNAAWREEFRASTKRGRRILLLVLLPMLFLAVSMVAWGTLSSGQREQDYERGYERGYNQFIENARKRVEERRLLDKEARPSQADTFEKIK